MEKGRRYTSGTSHGSDAVSFQCLKVEGIFGEDVQQFQIHDFADMDVLILVCVWNVCLQYFAFITNGGDWRCHIQVDQISYMDRITLFPDEFCCSLTDDFLYIIIFRIAGTIQYGL